jgi:UDP-N-acetyl-D-mannosaminuronic acid dehydrogenase
MAATMTISKENIATLENREKYTIGIIGCEREALATACLLAEAGFRIISVSTDQRLAHPPKRHKTLFHEPKLDKSIKKHLKTNRITVTTDTKEAASASSIIIFNVPTSIDKNEESDYTYFEKACREVGIGIRPGCLAIFQSAVGPGIVETVVKETIENASGLKAGVDFGLAYSPARATPGQVLRDIVTNPRIVGAISEESLNGACLLLSTITKGEIVKVANIRTAEAANMFENAYTNVNAALANELAQFCEKIGIDFFEAQNAANTNSHCHLPFPEISNRHISKNSVLLVEEAEAVKAKPRMLTLAKKANDGMLSHTLRMVKEALRSCGKTIRRAKILVLGVSSHPNTKEYRGSPTKKLVRTLKKRGAFVQVYDPFFSQKELEKMRYPAGKTLTKSAEGIDCLLIAVRHTRFKRLSLRRLKFLVRKPAAIVDMGHIVDPQRAEREGFVYRGIGRGV